MKQIKDPLTIALNYLRYRWRTEFEIRKKLTEKNFSSEEVNSTVNKLKENQIIDDLRFAGAWINQRSSLHPSGHYRLKQELKRLGVSESVINQAFQNVTEKDAETTDELTLAIEAGRRKSASYRSLPNEIFTRRMLGFLQRRGFSYSIAKKALAVLKTEI